MQAFNLTSALPVYLPYDFAHVPFGDPFNDVTITSASPAIVTVPGYQATSGDQVFFSVNANSSSSLASGLVSGNVYYVLGVVGNGFQVTSTSGGTGLNTTTSNSVSGQVVVHLVSNQIDGAVLPFKPNDTVLALNLGSTTVTLVGAADKYELAPGSVYPAGQNPPGGPGTYSTIASVSGSSAKLVVLGYDWILASGGNLTLLQN